MPGSEKFVARFLAGVPADVRDTFTAPQLGSIARAFGMRHASGHAVDFRRSIPTPWGRAYVVLLAGRDRAGS